MDDYACAITALPLFLLEGFLDLPFRDLPPQCLALIRGLLPYRQGHLNLGPAFLEINLQRHQGETALLCFADQLTDLVPVQQ
jgi:hypothetical protein